MYRRAALVLGAGLLLFAACTRGNAEAPPAAAAQQATRGVNDHVIDLELKDAPIFDALRALAAKARINLSLDSDVAGTVTLSVRARPWREVLDMIATTHALRVQEEGAVVHVSNASTPARTVHFTGKPMDVSFEDTAIQVVAKTFADFADVTIIVADDVQVSVTQRLRSLPWDQALDHIVRKYELQLVRTGDEIRITRR